MPNDNRIIDVTPESVVESEPKPGSAPMNSPPMTAPLRWTSSRAVAALAIAVAADALQWLIFPLFAAGAPAGADAVLDVAVAGLMTFLLGWHVAFIPTFLAELLPIVDLFPTWTGAAVFVVFRKSRKPTP